MAATHPYRRILVWFRRALRVDDNMALWHALHDGEEIVPVLCLSEHPAYQDLTERRKLLRTQIWNLDAGLRKRGTSLHVRLGSPERALLTAAAVYRADAVYAVALHDTPGLERDAGIKRALGAMGVAFVLWPDRVLSEANQILTKTDTPYKVYTPFRRAWLASADDKPRPVGLSRSITPVPSAEGTRTVHSLGWVDGVREFDVLKQLRSFLKHNVGRYHKQRDLPGVEGTSRLSPHLSIGSISIRRVYWESRAAAEHASPDARRGITTFVNELIWREFYYQILVHFPYVLQTAFREDFRSLRWSENMRYFDRWKEGNTGYPIVDAAMRQLSTEGWMHNRARMIVASFLTKDLHLSWQWGERHFLKLLTDADLASNNGGWQWTAGTGTDASPWFRIFNPVLQAKKFDPDGVYVRRYVPELRAVPVPSIHQPWKMNRQEQEAAGCIIGRSYPVPLVEHGQARAKTLNLYKSKQKGML